MNMRLSLLSLIVYVLILLLLFLLQWKSVPWLMGKAVPETALKNATASASSQDWASLVIIENHVSGSWIGRLETALIYTMFCFGGENVGLLVGGYLAFKVASKWEVWAHVYRVPERLDRPTGVTDGDFDFLKFRTRWGDRVFSRFVIGTILNLLFALAASSAYFNISLRLNVT